VSYPTAWRMLNKIRTELMRQDEAPLKGEVEVDETAGGGSTRGATTNATTPNDRCSRRC
jgi:hypothetical protein